MIRKRFIYATLQHLLNWSTYLNLDDQLHEQCESYRLCSRGRQSNGLAWMDHPLGMPWPFHGVLLPAFSGRKPLNHGEVPKIYDETTNEKNNTRTSNKYFWGYVHLFFFFGFSLLQNSHNFRLVLSIAVILNLFTSNHWNDFQKGILNHAVYIGWTELMAILIFQHVLSATFCEQFF